MKYPVATAAEQIARALAVAFLTVLPLHAQTNVIVIVDYAHQLGPSDQMASGFLHGINNTSPSQYLIDGVKLTTDRGLAYVSGEAPGETGPTEPGDHFPNLFDPATYARMTAANANVKLMAGLYDYVNVKGETYWPGDDGNETTWRNIVAVGIGCPDRDHEVRVVDQVQKRGQIIGGAAHGRGA